MKLLKHKSTWALPAIVTLSSAFYVAHAQDQGKTRYMKVDITEAFGSIMARMQAAKPDIERRHSELLSERYDLSDRPAHGVMMERNKPLQEGVRVKLPEGVTWEMLASLSPEEIRNKNIFPKGFYPLPYPNHPEGGMVFPHFEIAEIKKLDGRDLSRFDLDFDIPDHFLPAFPPAIYLTTRPDLGDVSQGKLLAIKNYYEIFNGILNPKQLEGLRLLLTPFPQQQVQRD
jgi:cytochrome c peroxidase